MIQKKIGKLRLGENFVKSYLQRKFYQDGNSDISIINLKRQLKPQ